MMCRLMVGMLCLSLAGPAGAVDIYRWTDADGTVIFSDTAQEGAEKIQLRETTVVPSDRPTVKLEPGVPEGVVAVPYAAVTIADPPAEATLRNTQMVGVSVAIVPALQADFGHRVQLYVDGAAYGAPSPQTAFILDDVDRGEHVLEAAVVDPDGSELARSPASKFYLHQQSIVKSKKPAKPPAP